MTFLNFFLFSAEFNSSDSSDDDIPHLSTGGGQQDYGRKREPFCKHKSIYTMCSGPCVYVCV